jgi:hypothetical protein
MHLTHFFFFFLASFLFFFPQAWRTRVKQLDAAMQCHDASLGELLA